MKKLISTVAALGLVAGVAGTASALDFSITGKYMLEGYMLSNANGQDKTLGTGQSGKNASDDGGFDPYDDDAGTDSAWVHTFLFKPIMKVNDKVTVKSEIRFAKDSDFGDGNNGGTTGKSDADLDVDLDVHKIWMEYKSPIGMFRMGRTPAGSWGGDYLSTATHADRVYWFPEFLPKPFSMYIYAHKAVDNDWYTGASDSDNDKYEINVDYKTDDMLLKCAYDFYNYKSNSDTGVATTSFDRQYSRINLYGDMKFGAVNVDAEFAYAFGDWQDYDVETAGVTEDRDIDTMAFAIGADTQMGDLNVGILYFWAQGQDDVDADADMEAGMIGLSDGAGDDFNPYYILTGDHTGMLNSDEYNADHNMVQAGVHCIGVSADMQVSDQLSLHGAIAMAWSDEDKWVENNAVSAGTSVDDEYGWEIDLGAKYKLLDNLTYELRGAYFNTGDFFDDIAKDNGQKSDDLYMLSHHLTMTF